MYDVLHPVQAFPSRFQGAVGDTEQERMQQLMIARVEFISARITLSTSTGKRYRSTTGIGRDLGFRARTRTAGFNSSEVFSAGDVFDFPKDVNVLARWIDLVTQSNPEALVLDFFAGSGSTGHAVMDLNAADGGNRRYILVQLDEPVDKEGYDTIADITRERLRRAGKQIASKRTLDAADIDTGFRSYRLAPAT